MRDKLLVSACLLGLCCKYDGGKLCESYELIPVCRTISCTLPGGIRRSYDAESALGKT